MKLIADFECPSCKHPNHFETLFELSSATKRVHLHCASCEVGLMLHYPDGTIEPRKILSVAPGVEISVIEF